ncbi:hypothetical protein U1Q18_001337 [Sarracenia purpurea var. burkii]
MYNSEIASAMFSTVTLEGLQLLRSITCLLYGALGVAEFWLFRADFGKSLGSFCAFSRGDFCVEFVHLLGRFLGPYKIGCTEHLECAEIRMYRAFVDIQRVCIVFGSFRCYGLCFCCHVLLWPLMWEFLLLWPLFVLSCAAKAFDLGVFAAMALVLIVMSCCQVLTVIYCCAIGLLLSSVYGLVQRYLGRGASCEDRAQESCGVMNIQSQPKTSYY